MSGKGGVGVVGLGLIGGSLARDLSAAGWRVQGDDRDAETLRRARAAGVVTGPISPSDVDVVVVAVPCRSIPDRLRQLARELPERVVVTDAGSTKRTVMEAAGAAGLGPRFVGAHPLAGDHRSGWSAARTGLFRGATVWCCTTPETTPEACTRVEALWRTVGAVPRPIDAAEHDQLMARVSHAPQVLASALALSLARAGVAPDRLGPGGRDMTRLAGSNPGVWTDILADNHDETAEALGALIEALTRFHRTLREGDDATLASLLAAARSWTRGEADRESRVAGSRYL